ncbi:tetratricopeptide repeat protein [Streptomyces sp. NPDC048209]|uniref:tetratricopeptide repeat protein n=1 Tax=Streptomyces sp. NPDC048209 TaxID=3156689 RepID=UPI00341ED8A5
MAMGSSGQRRARQQAKARGAVTQVAGDMHVHTPPMLGPPVEWPVWVGSVPRPAAAFQPRAQVRTEMEAARGRASDVVLSGPGGVGKSQLASLVARELRDQELSEESGLDVLVWVRAARANQVISTYAEAADRLRLPGLVPDDEGGAARLLLRWLATTRRRWLVVLDDVTDLATVREWWPDSGAGRGWVLATSRREDAQLSGQGRALIRVDLYTDSEARAFLQRRLTDAGHAHLHDPVQAGEIVAELGHLPLALGHAAAYLINKRCSMADYLTLLRDATSRLTDLLPSSADTEGYGRPVTASLLLSLDAVEDADSSRLARPLLLLASLMDPLGHPAMVWTTPEALDHLRTARPPQRFLLRKRHLPVTETQVHNALECLRTYALITQDVANAPLRMHALTARAVREAITPGTLPVIARTAADSITSLWPRHDHEDRELAALLRANAIHLAESTGPALWQPTTHPCIFKVSRSLNQAGLLFQMIEYDETIFHLSSSIHGPNHRDTITARSNLANSYNAAGRVQEALDLCEEVLAYRQQVLGPDHPDTHAARNNLANSYRTAGRVQEALDLCEKVLAYRQQVLGPDHPNTHTARNNLAITYSAAGRVQDALDLREKVLAYRQQVLGPDHPNTHAARNNLANSYSAAGRVQDALDLREKVLADRERVLGPDHPDTITARHNLANSYRAAGRVQDALDLCEEVLADRERVLGPDHPDTLGTRNNLAICYRAAGRVQEALDLCEEVLADRERVQSPDHPDTITARSNLANSYRTAGRVQEALDLCEEVLAYRERVQSPDHPDTLGTRNNLAICYRAAGREQDALDLCEEVLADCERALGSDHPITRAARHNLANSYSAAGREQDALDLREKVLADCERALGPDHPDTITARHLANSYSRDHQRPPLTPG